MSKAVNMAVCSLSARLWAGTETCLLTVYISHVQTVPQGADVAAGFLFNQAAAHQTWLI